MYSVYDGERRIVRAVDTNVVLSEHVLRVDTVK